MEVAGATSADGTTPRTDGTPGASGDGTPRDDGTPHAGLADKNSGEDISVSRTVFVGNLSDEVSEDMLVALFNTYGPIKSYKLIKESSTSSEPFGFIEFEDRRTAELALTAMGGREVLGRKIKVNWATGAPAGGSGNGGSGQGKQYSVFVGDIGPEMTEAELKNHFAKFGTITGCRVVKDTHTSRSKNYGFVSFDSRADAETAIRQMNGFWTGTRTIRTNWASRNAGEFKNGPSYYGSRFDNPVSKHHPAFESISRQTGPTNCTIFVGNLSRLPLSDDLLRELFSQYGPIVYTRAFITKGYGFVTFAHKTSAVRAIIGMEGTVVQGNPIKVNWSKEPRGESQLSHGHQYPFQMNANPSTGSGYSGTDSGNYHYNQQQQQQQYPYNQSSMGYWYQNPLQGYPLLQNYQQTNPNYYQQFPSSYGYGTSSGAANNGTSQTSTSRNTSTSGFAGNSATTPTTAGNYAFSGGFNKKGHGTAH